VLGILLSVILGVIALIAAGRAMMMLRSISISEVLHVLAGAGATLLRVDAALLIAALWTIPAGVAIGFHPKLARIAQPVAQIAASFPATVIFPLIIIGLTQIHMGLGIGSSALMLLGTQWYVLFNVIAGAMAIPSDLREVASLFRFGSLQRWSTVILPGIFPYLITGMVTASGGAWNASIIAEYYHLKDKTYTTLGLGAEISQASDHGQYALLLLSTLVMALMVVTINRLLWRRLYRLAETRYKLEG
jgi:NitT/TauT family transport system permease protein